MTEQLTIQTTEPYAQMLSELREHHGDEIDAHLRAVVEQSIHESYQETHDQ